MGQANSADLPDGLSGIFSRAGLDRLLGDLPVRQSHKVLSRLQLSLPGSNFETPLSPPGLSDH
jgi:hypothetical protein